MKKLLKKLLLPSILFITTLAYSVTLSWDKNVESDVSGYVLYWGTTATGTYTHSTNVGNVSTFLLSNTNFTYMTKYYMVCTAVNTSGLESLPSNQIIFIITNDVVPSAVKNFKITTLKP